MQKYSYTINDDLIIDSDRALSDAEIDEIVAKEKAKTAKPPVQPQQQKPAVQPTNEPPDVVEPEQPSFWGDIFNAPKFITEPAARLGSWMEKQGQKTRTDEDVLSNPYADPYGRIAQRHQLMTKGSDQQKRTAIAQELREQQAKSGSFLAGATESAASQLSPANIALGLVGAGEVAAVRGATSGFATAAQAAAAAKTAAKLGLVRKAAGWGQFAHGGGTMLHPESTWEERMWALPELAGGFAAGWIPPSIRGKQVRFGGPPPSVYQEGPITPGGGPPKRLPPPGPRGLPPGDYIAPQEPTGPFRGGGPGDILGRQNIGPDVPPPAPNRGRMFPPPEVMEGQVLPPQDVVRQTPQGFEIDLSQPNVLPPEIIPEIQQPRNLDPRISGITPEYYPPTEPPPSGIPGLAPTQGYRGPTDLAPYGPQGGPTTSLAPFIQGESINASLDAARARARAQVDEERALQQIPPIEQQQPQQPQEPKIRTEIDIRGNTRVWVNDQEYTGNFGPGGPTQADIQTLHRQIRDPESFRRLEELKAQQAGTQLEGITPLPPAGRGIEPADKGLDEPVYPGSNVTVGQLRGELTRTDPSRIPEDLYSGPTDKILPFEQPGDEIDALIQQAGLEQPPEMQVVEGQGPNASGESAASLEAISRGQGMKTRGEQYVVYDRSGGFRPLIGPEAVDYVARPGETFGIEGPQGFIPLDDKGGRYIDEPSMQEPPPPPPPPPPPITSMEPQIAPEMRPHRGAPEAMTRDDLIRSTLNAIKKVQESRGINTQIIGATSDPDFENLLSKAKNITPQPPPTQSSEFDQAKDRQVHGQLMDRMGELTPEEIQQLDSTDEFGNPLSLADRGLENKPPSGIAAPSNMADMVPGDAQEFGPNGELISPVPTSPNPPIAPTPPAEKPISQRQKVSGTGEIIKEWTPAQVAERRAGIRSNWGITRAKARELGIQEKGVNDIKQLQAVIQAADPNWTPPGGLTPEGPKPSTRFQKKGKAGDEPRGTLWDRLNDETGSLYAEESLTDFDDRTIEIIEEAWNLPRGLVSVDLPYLTSAAFRQGAPWAFTRHWRKAWGQSAAAFGEEGAYTHQRDMMERDPMFAPTVVFEGNRHTFGKSKAQQVGLQLTDLTNLTTREDQIRGTWAEKMPGIWGRYIKRSNRAFTAFINHVRAYGFKELAEGLGVWDGRQFTNEPLARELAEFVNSTTGRASYKMKFGISPEKSVELNLERFAPLFANIGFSPRNWMGRIKLLNPMTYTTASPPIRMLYMKAFLRMAGTWMTITSLLKIAGAKVSTDPNSSDYGKARFGNTRFDPGGGHQQPLVLAHRILHPRKIPFTDIEARMRIPKFENQIPGVGTAIDMLTGPLRYTGGGITSPASGQFNPYGEGFKPETQKDDMIRYMSNQLNPSARYIFDWFARSERYPFHLIDKTVGLAVPMYAGDLAETIKDDPMLTAPVLAAGSIGVGSQTFEGGPGKPTLTPLIPGLSELEKKYFTFK